MTHRTGDRIGGFEVVAQLGEGGMGEVYRARDTKLDREVALKVLPATFVSDPDRLARFEREAKVLAQLNHPNIAQIYGFDANAIAMELVEGPTLDELIRDHRAETGAGLPFDRALAIARQIAVALEVAHDQGIVHRDLKPANIKVRDDGTVKVLDFGLAKAFAADAEAQHSAVANSPTLTARATQLGMIIGTAAYMSPEQAKARPVDRRADVWAFGVVFFEMLAGRRVFEGEDVSDVLASVLKTDPDWNLLPADLPAPARRLLRRCLEKDPKKRLRDIAEGILQLDEGLASGSTTSTITAVRPETPADQWRGFFSRWGAIGITAVVTALVVAGIGRYKTPKPVPPAVARLLHIPPAAAPLFISVFQTDVAVSPDGRMLAYSSGMAGNPVPHIYLRALDQLEAVPVRGAQPAVSPFFSPSGDEIGFIDQVDQTLIKRIFTAGGPASTVTKASHQIMGAAWTNNGIVFGGRRGGLHVVNPSGGEARELTSPEGDEVHVWPAWVPDTDVVLFATGNGTTGRFEGKLAAFDRAAGRMVRLNIAGTHPRYLHTGHIVYSANDGTLSAIAFDARRMELTGSPVPVLEGIGLKASGAANFDISSRGDLVYSIGGQIDANRTLTWVDRTGRETPIPAPERNYYYARISPDGARLSLDTRDEEQDIWVWDLRRDDLSRLTDKAGPDQYGLWLPDHRLVFNSTAASRSELFLQRSDGVGEPVQMSDSAGMGGPFPNAVTPDGKQVIFRAIPAGSAKNDLFLVDITGSQAKPRKLLSTEHDERNAALSPRGDYMVFESDLSGGRFEVFIRPFPDVDRVQVKISTDGGQEPVWSPTGREIFYLSNGRLMSVPVTITATGVDVGRATSLFQTTSYFFGGIGRNYDVSADGRRFVMVKSGAGDSARSAPITMVLNWAEEVRARTPASR